MVGNGPSLAWTDVDKLIGEVSIATNNVHLAYPSVKWRPTIYVRAEQGSILEPEHWLESLKVHIALGTKIYCNDYFFRPRFGLKAPGDVHYLKSCAHYGKHFDNPDIPHLWHLPVLCTFGSSVNVAIQLAVQMGFSPIYLVGCDLGYRDGQPSHFVSDYEHGREQPARYANMDTLAAHMIAARSCPGRIYNATLGGELEVYNRVDYDTLF